MTQIKLRRDTSANFTSKNPILGIGEPAYETDTKKLKIGDGTTAYASLDYFSTGGGGGSTNISATLPLKIVDGVISLEVDGQTIQIVDGKLHANLDELGNEVNNLSGRVTAVEADILTKENKITTTGALSLQEKIQTNAVGFTVTSESAMTNNYYQRVPFPESQSSRLYIQDSSFTYPYKSYLAIPYSLGQVIRVPRAYGQLFFGSFDDNGDFIVSIGFNTFYYDTSGFALFGGPVYRAVAGSSEYPPVMPKLNPTQMGYDGNYTYHTPPREAADSGNLGSLSDYLPENDFSCAFYQISPDTTGAIMIQAFWSMTTGRCSTAVYRDTETSYQYAGHLDAMRNNIQYALWLPNETGTSYNPSKFGLYDWNVSRIPCSDASGWKAFFEGRGANLYSLTGQSSKNYLELNIGSGLSVVDGKLTVTGGGDVTAAGDNTFTGKNTFSNQIIIPSDFNGVKGICIDGQSNASIYATGDYLNLRNVGQLSGGSGSDLIIGTETQKTQIRGSSVVDKRSKIFLTQGNVTAGDNVTITDTTDGIQISATSGSSSANIPLAFGMSQYYKGEMDNASWLKSTGQQNTKALYPDFYAWVLEKANAGTDGFKLSTATDITDYDFVINTTAETFRLPLKNGQENLPDYSDNQISLPMPFPKPYVAPSDGYLVGGLTAGTANTTLSINGRPAGITNKGNGSFSGSVIVNIAVKKGDVITIDDYFRDDLYFIPLQGNGNLYYYCGNTVQNETMIDIGKIGEQLATKTDMLQASGASMPSSRYIDLTLGETGSTYTAPANGWLVLAKFAGASGEYVQFSATNSTLGDRNNFITTSAAPVANYVCDCFMPMKKGQSTTVNYYATGDTLAFRFVYAEGEK